MKLLPHGELLVVGSLLFPRGAAFWVIAELVITDQDVSACGVLDLDVEGRDPYASYLLPPGPRNRGAFTGLTARLLAKREVHWWGLTDGNRQNRW